MTEPILVARTGGVARITLNRPESLNALAGSMRENLLEAVRAVAGDGTIRCLVITGAGRAFCAGGDIKRMAELKAQNAAFDEVGERMETGGHVVMALRNLDIPVVAAVNGAATGAGLDLALACDLRIASDVAVFGATFSRIGLHPDWGGTWFLPRAVGASRALRMIWTGELLKADKAREIGLVDEVFPAAEHMAEVDRLAERLAAAPPVATKWAKRAIRHAENSDLETMIGFEIEAQKACWESEDSREGINAFVEKRTAQFK